MVDRVGKPNVFVGPLSFLDIEQIDTDLYRGCGETWPGERENIYGGQVAAQALLAAAYTVPDDRLPHSLHGSDGDGLASRSAWLVRLIVSGESMAFSIPSAPTSLTSPDCAAA